MWQRVLLISVIPAIVLVAWAWQDLSPSGAVSFHKKSTSMTKNISQFYPEGRLGESSIYSDFEVQPVQGEPIYFDVRLPRVLQEIEVKITAIGDTEGLVIGLRQPPSPSQPWRYSLKQPTITNFGEYKIISQTFPLTDSYVEDGKVRFLLSVPTGNEVSIGNIEVNIVGESLHWQDFVTAIKHRLPI